MSEWADKWIRVSNRRPCPLCGKPDNCEISADGVMVWCGRVSDGAVRENAGGQFLHRVGNESPRLHVSVKYSASGETQRPTVDWHRQAQRYFRNAASQRAALAERLGVSSVALEKLQVGWDATRRVWTFPERDGRGRIVGIMLRYADGTKRRLKGSKSGLVYCDDWDSGCGPILLMEGSSDTAAGLTMGSCTIGRPSNSGGVALLTHLLDGVPTSRPIIVLGENDAKPSGLWPGRDGATSTAHQLAEDLERSILWAMPPGGFKDTRSWLRAMPALSAGQLYARFMSQLQTIEVKPPIILETSEPNGPELSVDCWRNKMLAARIRSLEQPGCYLDTSPTGAGKSHVDIRLLQHIASQETW